MEAWGECTLFLCFNVWVMIEFLTAKRFPLIEIICWMQVYGADFVDISTELLGQKR